MSGISFSSKGYKLAGNFYIPNESQKHVAFLFIQGWAGDQNLDAARAITQVGYVTTQVGYVTMTYDMRGHGNSEGNLEHFSRADFIEDAVAAYDYFRHRLRSGVAISHTLGILYDRVFLISQSFLPGVNDLLLGSLLYRSRLVPRVLSMIGIFGDVLVIAGFLAVYDRSCRARYSFAGLVGDWCFPV